MGKYKICVYAIAKNESKFVKRWVDSMQEADAIYVLDTGSTDDTAQKLKELGVNVKIEKITPWRFDIARNKSLELVPKDTDICVCTDLDEVLQKGWRKELEKVWTTNANRIRYTYNWRLDSNNNPLVTFLTDKMHSRNDYIWTHPVHEILTFKGEKENILKVSIELDKAIGMSVLTGLYVNGANASADLVREAAEDSYSRLVYPAVEREIRNDLTARASADAIKVFAANTAQLLMQPPVRGKVTIGLDPGYRTGCKVAVVDETGKVLDTAVIYCAPPHSKIEEAKKTIKDLVKRYGVQMFAIGNGTASHETEVFAADVIRELDCGITYMVVSEAGASVYSASKLAAQEFPQYDVSLRSAVSIARRLQDPLAELVKIDPKSIGVGQYQHDMPQKELNHALDAVVEDCVNSVGVDLNTASPSLLQRVSGVSASVAENIVRYREENGAFTSRTELLNVPKLGPKAYEQCAGFLRIPGGRNVLDNTAVHPESYGTAENLLKICGVSKSDVANGKVAALTNTVKSRGIKTLAAELGTGEPTLADIVSEISKPGRDPREALPAPMLRTDVMGMEDLKPGMELKGTVRNVIDFGAFVDVGVHQDGLVHISQISDKFIRHPSEVLKVGQIVTVWVLSVDTAKKRISLTMKKPE